MQFDLIITPKTKIGELLSYYPELEDTLIAITPVFKKLKNPILRKTIAKVTSLEQAARVAEIPVHVVVNKLRNQVGQDDLELNKNEEYVEDKPDWLDSSKIVKENDVRKTIEAGGHPLGEVMQFIAHMKSGEIYLLITSFFPAPLVEKVQEIGLKTFTEKESGELFKNYFYKI